MNPDYQKIEELLNNISMNLISYEDGDLMLISDIIDNVNELKSLLSGVKQAEKIIGIIHNILLVMLKGEKLTESNVTLSNGIDLITKLVKDKKERKKGVKKLDEFLKNDILNYENKNKSYIDKKQSKPVKVPEAGKKSEDAIIDLESLTIFMVEADEKIIEAQDHILALEKDLKNKDILNKLFRIFHTIKGECGFLRIASLAELSHNIENLLDLLRNDEIENNQRIIEILLDGIDHSKEILRALKNGDITIFNTVKIDDISGEIMMLKERVKKPIGEILEEEGKINHEEILDVLQKQKEASFTKKIGEIMIEEDLLTEDDLEESINKQKIRSDYPENKIDKVDPIIKVKASQINYLVDMVGELLIAENQIDDADRNIIKLRKITRQIQYAAMQLRTTKIRSLFSSMKRIVRDTSRKLDVKVITETVGEDLEIDRTLVEILEEPLMHIIRNAVYHGIEPAKERIGKEKSEEGKIIIKAERKGNNIIVSVCDDGKGLDRDKILEKAISKSIINKENAGSMNKNEIYNLIFLQGFSTADSVDYVSGRGVGMDIVKSIVTSYRGKVEIESEKDLYTKIKLVFPLSTAIIDGMIVVSEGINFIIPVSNIIESLIINEEMLSSVNNKIPVISFRDEVIPIIKLSEYFEICKNIKEKKDVIGVIVENNEKKKFALSVDQILAKKEIVIKPLGSKFKNLYGISSGTVLAGGKIGFIIDVEQVVSCAEGMNN